MRISFVLGVEFGLTALFEQQKSLVQSSGFLVFEMAR